MKEKTCTGSKMEETVQAFKAYDPAYLDPRASHIIPKMMHSQRYFLVMPLGIREKHCTYLPLPTSSPLFILGYQPYKREVTICKRQMLVERIISENRHKPKRPILQPYQLTLNVLFVREGEDYPCYNIPEPLI